MDKDKGTPISRRTALGGMGAAATIPLVGPVRAAVPRRVEGKVALVTGSSRNLGRATVLELARQGADVVVNGRSNREAAEATAEEARALGARAITLLADAGDQGQVETMVDATLEEFGRIDIAIANAAWRGSSSLIEMSNEDWHACAAVNFDGPFYLARAVLPSMIENEYGRIITISGLNSFHGRPGWSHVCGSKMGAIGMTRALATEVAQYNIMVNHVVPGAYVAHQDLNRIPVGRLGLPEELANLYAFLASEESNFITGQVFHHNGGELRV